MENALTFVRRDFWEGDDTAVLLNPSVPCADEDWLRDQPWSEGQVIFRTSGSEGAAKFVCLSKAALLASARAVNTHLEATSSDVWLGWLPLFHVGGLGIAARAFAADAEAIIPPSRWDPHAFTQQCGDVRATLTALVPTQVYDLVMAGCQAPTRLRAVLVGGGALEAMVESQARGLGWPILTTYGMTETASQVATQRLGCWSGDPMQVLPIWETRLASSGCLQVRGPALFSGYVIDRDFIDPRSSDGWFETTDQVILSACEGRTTLHFKSRQQGLVKIKGELLSLHEVRAQQARLALLAGLDPHHFTTIALSDARDGQRLIWVSDSEIDDADSEALRAHYNSAVAGHWRMLASASVTAFPRTALGKLAEKPLVDLVTGNLAEASA